MVEDEWRSLTWVKGMSSDALSTADFTDLFERLAKVSTVNDDNDYLYARAMRAAIEQFQAEDWQDAVSKHPDGSLLTVYQSDGWGATLKSGSCVGIQSRDKIFRKTQWRHEFLLQRFIFTLMHSQGVRRGMRLSAPLSLRNGATAFHVYEAYCGHATFGPRKSGHRGVIMDGFCFDGALFKALRRHISASVRLYYMEACETKPGSEDPILDIKHWTFFIKCWHHSLSNGVIKGLAAIMRLVKDEDCVFLSNQALVEGGDELRLLIQEFIHVYVDYQATPSGSLEDRVQLWLLLGAKQSMADMLAYLDIGWDFERKMLLVSAVYEGRTDVYEKLEIALLFFMRWSKWSKTRWGRSGSCARMFVGSLLCGVDGLFQMAEERGSSMHKLGSFKQASSEVRAVYVTMATATYPLESLVFELWQDDCGLRRSQELQTIMADEYSYVLSIPEYCWRRLSEITNKAYSFTFLRCEVLKASLVSIAYFHWDSLVSLEEYPLSLTQEDIEANVNLMAQLPAEEVLRCDPTMTTSNIHSLLSTGSCQVPKIVADLELMRDRMSVTTDLVEEAHGSGACLVKHHDQLEMVQLQHRSVLHQGRDLPKPTEMQTFIDRRDAKIEKLMSKMSQKRVGGHHMRVGDSLRKLNESSADSARPVRVTKRVHEKCRASNPRTMAVSEARALGRHVQTMGELQNDLVHVNQSVTLHEGREREDELHSVANHNANFRWTPGELEKLRDLFFHHFESQSRDPASQAASESPGVPSASEQAVLHGLEQQMGFGTEGRAVPWFAKEIAKHADYFSDVAISTCAVEGHMVEQAFVPMYCHGSPQDAMFLELRRNKRRLPYIHLGDDLELPNGSLWAYIPFKFYRSDKLPLSGDELLVWPHISFSAECEIISEPVEWAMFTRHLYDAPPAIVTQPRVRLPKLTAQEIDDLLKEHAWLRRSDLDFSKPLPMKVKPVAGVDKSDDSSSLHPSDHESDVDSTGGHERGSEDEAHAGGHARIPDARYMPMSDELARIAEEFGDDVERNDRFFITTVLRGRWTEEHTGDWWDRLEGTPRAGLPHTWCDRYNFPKRKSWSRRAHTERGALLMSSEYQRRATFFFSLWLEQCGEDASWSFEYTQEVLDSYRPSLEYLTWAVEVPLGSRTYKCLTELTEMLPRRKAFGS